MARFWVIGDSFCDSSHCADQWGWWQAVSDQLGLDLQLRAHSGCSTQWQLRQWLQVRSQLRPEDIVIYVHTHTDRIWFYEHLPWMTSPHVLDRHSLPRWSGRYKIEEITRAEAQGLVPQVRADWCERHWETAHWTEMNRDLQEIITRDVLAQPVRRALVLSAFPDQFARYTQPGVVGTLSEISFGEFRETVDAVALMMQRGDPRSGHLSRINHVRLAERIKAFILGTDVNLDLNQGFEARFLREKDVWPDR